MWAAFATLAVAAAGPTKFAFGPGQPPAGFTAVAADAVYSKERGYGFEPGFLPTADKPFFFSVAVPEGNYTVTLTLGDPAGPSDTTVKAELRRLVLERVTTPTGKTDTRTVTVNVRTPVIPGGKEVKLKDREKTDERWAWDEKLTLEFNGPRPRLRTLEVAPADVPTVYLLGDSTVCDQPREPYASWGQMLPRFFGPGLAVANHAESGETLRGSRAAGRFDKVLAGVRPGDYLFVQYGHNDMKAVTADVYKSELSRLVADARGRGAAVVLVTPVNRRSFEGGTVTNSLKDFPDAVRSMAREADVPLIDLHAMSKTLYESLGPEKSGALFKTRDGTHHNNYGAYELARCVVEGVRGGKLGLAKFLADDAKPFDPARPDPVEGFTLPASPLRTTMPPEGK